MGDKTADRVDDKGTTRLIEDAHDAPTAPSETGERVVGCVFVSPQPRDVDGRRRQEKNFLGALENRNNDRLTFHRC